MNKKLAIGISIVVGGVMMATTALASGSSSNGYDAYKDAFKNTRAATSVTGTVGVTVTDNSSVLLKSNDVIKLNRNTNNMSGSFNLAVGNQVESALVYRQNDQTIINQNGSKVYNIVSMQRPDSKKWGKAQENPALAHDAENVVDMLVGNFQNYISLDSKADGNKLVSLQLSGNQISPIANAVASLVVRERTRELENNQPNSSSFESVIKNQMPTLVDDIRVTDIELKAEIDNHNLIQEQTAKVTITGKDAAGKNHQVVVSIDLNLSNLNNTTPNSVDLTGKQVNTIQPKDNNKFGHLR